MQASYGVEDAEYAMIQLAQTTMRSELGESGLHAEIGPGGLNEIFKI